MAPDWAIAALQPLHCVRWSSSTRKIRLHVLIACLAAILQLQALAAAPVAAILVYHRFGPTVADSMTTRTAMFEAQIAQLRSQGFVILPLSRLVAGLQGSASLPPRAIAISVDDGHRTVYTELLPIIRRERLPLALFIYPSAISNASYAMTWNQLGELVATGLVEVHSHTWWHPDFRVERRRLTPEAYQRFVRRQLEEPRWVLKSKLGVEADFLAWPFGIVDDELEAAAAATGYRAAFALGQRHASAVDSPMAFPRYLVVDGTGVSGLIRLLRDGERRATVGGQP